MTTAENLFQNTETTPENLQALTSQILNSLLPRAVEHQCFFINDIPAELPLQTDARKLKSLLGKLFSVVVSHAKNSCIRLRTKIYGNVVLMHLEDAIGDLQELERDLKQLEPAAEHMMSTVLASSWRNNRVVVTFGFTNLPLLD